jgi:hypothetical protein
MTEARRRAMSGFTLKDKSAALADAATPERSLS